MIMGNKLPFIPPFRTGFGVDVHQLSGSRQLFIGGVEIPSDVGAVGHSDADVLLHAICDALLGSLNLRDIGFHFPDTDPKFEGIDSKILLRETYKLIRNKGYLIGNIDATIMLEAPKVNPYITSMQEVIAGILSCETDQISIKATRGEKMGFVGNREGIKAYASVLIYREQQH